MIKRVFTITLGLFAFLFAIWFLCRASTLGVANVFSHEATFVDSRPLTEDVAIELSRRTLRAQGYDVTHLAPYQHEGGFHPDYPGDRIFSRNLYNSNHGTVTWVSTRRGNGFDAETLSLNVNIEKHKDEIRCRAFRPK